MPLVIITFEGLRFRPRHLLIFFAVEQGMINIIQNLLCHLTSVFAVSLGGHPYFIALCNKQGVMGIYSYPGSEQGVMAIYCDPDLQTKGQWRLILTRASEQGVMGTYSDPGLDGTRGNRDFF